MLTDNTYFIGEINIAQLGQEAVQDKLNVFISKREPEFLCEVLGCDFADLFTAGLAGQSIDARWTSLKTGDTFTDHRNIKRKWYGFVNDAKSSPIANYIYYWFMRDNASFSAVTGEVKGSAENSTVTSGAPKMIRAWNEMIDLIDLLHNYLKYAKDAGGNCLYPEFDRCQVTFCNEKISYL